MDFIHDDLQFLINPRKFLVHLLNLLHDFLLTLTSFLILPSLQFLNPLFKPIEIYLLNPSIYRLTVNQMLGLIPLGGTLPSPTHERLHLIHQFAQLVVAVSFIRFVPESQTVTHTSNRQIEHNDGREKERSQPKGPLSRRKVLNINLKVSKSLQQLPNRIVETWTAPILQVLLSLVIFEEGRGERHSQVTKQSEGEHLVLEREDQEGHVLPAYREVEQDAQTTEEADQDHAAVAAGTCLNYIVFVSSEMLAYCHVVDDKADHLE